jgi:hypothetical protein
MRSDFNLTAPDLDDHAANQNPAGLIHLQS